MDARSRAKEFAIFVFCYLSFNLLALAFHEYVHASVLALLGYGSTVMYFFVYGVTIPSQPIADPVHVGVVALSGGALAGLCFLALYSLLDYRTDLPEKLVSLYVAAAQLAYAPLELSYCLGWVPQHAALTSWTIVNALLSLAAFAKLLSSLGEADG